MNNIYRQLQKHLDKLPVGFPPTKSGVEIDILKILFSKIEAKIALCLSLNDSSIKKIQKRMEKKGCFGRSAFDYFYGHPISGWPHPVCFC